MSTPGGDGVRARLDRLRGQTIRGGLLTPEGAAALASVGFEPVTEVIGALVKTVTPNGFYSSGIQPTASSAYLNQMAQANQAAVTGPRSWRSPRTYPVYPTIARGDYETFTSSSHNVRVGVPTEVTAVKDGYRMALNRLLAEATAAGADGVVDLKVERTNGHLSGTQRWSFLAIGTAVRSIGRVRSDKPFTTDLGPVQVASAIRSGWMPLSYLMIPCMAIRAVDPWSQQQRRRLSENGEIAAYTDLVNTCRHQARTDFRSAAAALGADAAVQSDFELELELGKRDEAVASVKITGTALARFDTRTVAPHSLTIIPLR